MTTSPRDAAIDTDHALGRPIALARWAAIAVALVGALTASPPPMGSPAAPGVVLGVIALYNIPATVAGRWRWTLARRITVTASAGDVLAGSTWVVLGGAAGKQSLVIVVAVLLECAVLGGWRALLPASAAALAALAASAALDGALLHHTVAPAEVAFAALALLGVTLFAGWFAATARRRRLALIDHAATDPLTGARNRRALSAALGALPRVPFAVVAIDVDNLKPINDEYGHDAGDEVLRTVARVISEIARSGDIVARVGGDEFAVVLLALEAAEAVAVGERMRAAMHGVTVRRGRVRVSVGVAVGSAGASALAVWHEADAALLDAKHSGGDRVADTPGPSLRLAEPTRVAAIIDAAIASRALEISFQPVVTLRTGEIAGYEALAHPPGWTDESAEPLFRAAGPLGLARDLDWVCRRAALDAVATLPPHSAVFLNVTAAALLDPVHDVDQMLLVLASARVEPLRVVLELNERERIGDLGRLRHVLAGYRDHGFRIALDDVGEGQSSLEVLGAALPDFLKVARSLVRDESRGARAAIEAAVAFAGATQAAVIAVGIESAATAAALADLGVTLGQGGWLARSAAEAGEVTVRGRAVAPLSMPAT